MSFLYAAVGFMLLIGSVMMGALVALNFIPPMIYIIIATIIGAIGGVIVLLIALLMRGILGPMMSARMTGKTLIAVLTANKNLDLEAGWESEGIVDTRRGGFIVPTDTVYSWPNGVRGGIGFFKYGVTLDPKMIKASSVLKKNDIKDINQLDKAQEIAKSQDKEINVDLKEAI